VLVNSMYIVIEEHIIIMYHNSIHLYIYFWQPYTQLFLFEGSESMSNIGCNGNLDFPNFFWELKDYERRKGRLLEKKKQTRSRLREKNDY
jgi:hypothetical protein